MLRFFKKIGESRSTNITNTTDVEKTNHKDNEQQAPSKYMRVDLNALPSDPGERPSMENYHVNQRDEIRRHYLQKGPCQPRNHSFERREIGGRVRKFNPSWFDDHKYWLEYSIELEAAFCLCCYLFKSEIKNQGGADNFVKDGFKAWNKRDHLDLHNNGGPHNMAVQKCQNLMNQAQSIPTIFDKLTYLTKDKNRIKIHASIDCVRFLLRQGLPFRGHNESADSRNKGNFLELLHFYAERNDKVGNAVLKNAPKSPQMKSSSIQKDILHAAASETLKVIRKEIGDNFFAILVDESRDISCKEQMALVLRFVNDKGFVVERFVGIKHVDDTSSLSLKATIYSMLSDLELSYTKIRGEGYDGASNMRSAFNGLKTLIMNDVPSAYYIHCFSHQLQLALVFVAKNHHDINDFFELTSRLLNMIGASYKRRDKLRDKHATRVVAALDDGNLESGTSLNQDIGIKRPSDTRWGSHYGSLLNIKTLYPSICEVLEDVMEDANCQYHRSEARRMLKSILTFDFVFCLHLMVEILGITNDLNTTLQRKDQDIINAMHQVRASKERLQIWNARQPLLGDITSFGSKYDVEIPNMEGLYYSGISRRKGSKVSNLHHYRVDVFYSVIDMQLQELNNRFNEENKTLFISIASLCPRQSFKSFKLDELMKMAGFYPNEFPSGELEALKGQLQNYIKDVRKDTRFNDLRGLGDLAKKMVESNKHEIYPKVYVLLKLALTLPVATSTVERAFSAMKLIKSDLRNKMGDDFMNNCLVSYIEKDVFNSISNDVILENFRGMKYRKDQL